MASSRDETFFYEAKRVQESLLAPLEGRCLKWMAQRTPTQVVPDHLTALGFVALLFAGIFYYIAQWWPAALLINCGWLAMNWLGDSLDGTVARLRNQQRPRYGFYVDHMADSIGALFVLGGLSVSGYMAPAVAVALLVGFLLLSINSYLATYTLGTFHLSIWRFSPTEMRLLLALGNVVAFWKPNVVVLGMPVRFFDLGGTAAAMAMAAILVISVKRNVLALYRLEKTR